MKNTINLLPKAVVFGGLLILVGCSAIKVDVDVYVLDTGVSNSDLNVTQALDFRPGLNDPQDTDGHGKLHAHSKGLPLSSH